MIYILAGSYSQAKKWAAAQLMADEEWFCTLDLDELKQAYNFHVIIHESASELPPPFFEKVFSLAHMRGRINRL
jgi:hypothetical protein